MDARWWPLVWVLGAIGGYALFMWQQPLGAIFKTARQFARNNWSIIVGLAGLLVVALTWRFWQAQGLGSANTATLQVSSWGDLMVWVPDASTDLRSVFWFCVPLDMAFAVGTPVASLTCWYWMPRLWKACAGGHRWIAGVVVGIYALAFWWWAGRTVALLGLGMQIVPEWSGLQYLLRGIGEGIFAVVLATFIQMVLLLGAYRSHGSGKARCDLREALDWALKCYPRILPITALALAGVGINWLATERLQVEAAAVWDILKLVVLIASAALPVCLLLLHDLVPWEAARASVRFLGRTAWRFSWFLFLCWTHFFVLRLLESYLLSSALTNEFAVQAWYVVAAILRAALTVWFINAWCLYFCIDVTQRQKTKKTGGRTLAKPLKLATLQARLKKSKRKGFFAR